MISYGFLFTITNNSNETTQFQLADNHVASHYSKSRNFGNQNINELTVFRADISIKGYENFDTTHTLVESLYNFFSEALEDQPCHLTIDFYSLPEPIDVEDPEYDQNLEETLYTPEHFIKRVVQNAEIGSVTYDVTPMNYSISESTTIELNPNYLDIDTTPEFEDGDF